MKKIILFLLLLAQLMAVAVAGAAPSVPPRPTGNNIYVQDHANIIAASDENKIISMGQELERATTAQVSVLTVASLEGASIEDYALSVLRTWGVGQKDKNNGVLIVIAPNERRSRIEVGYGLEGTLPDGLTGRIQDKYMLPLFKAGDYSEGIVLGYEATASIIARSEGATLGTVQESRQEREAAIEAQDKAEREQNMKIYIMSLIFIALDMLFFKGRFTRVLLYALLLGRGGRGGRGGGGGFGGGSGGGGGSSRSW